jgi:cytochrome c oxidase subunit 2
VKAAQMKKDSSVPQEPGGVVIVASKDPTAEFGAGLYKVKGCNACHSLDGSKIVGPTFKGVWGKTEKTDKGDVTVDLAYLTESVLQPTAKIVDGFPPAMPPQQLNELEIKSIGLFLETLK